MRPPYFYKQGQVILIALVFFTLFSIITATLVGLITTYAKAERYKIAAAKALYLAEAGISKAAYELNQSPGYTGESALLVGEGEISIAVSSIDAYTKQVTATGYLPDSANPLATRVVKVKVGLNSSVVSFRFGVQVGEGGVVMNNGSQIIGNLFSNGSVDGSASNGAATITGDVTVAGGTQATPGAEWTTYNGSTNLGDVSGRVNLAQSFTLTSTTNVNKVGLYLTKVGSPGDLTLKIVTDNGGKPSNNVLATGSLPTSNVGTSLSFAEGNFTTSPTLTSGVTYWVIAIASVSASNYFVWGSDTTDAYANGTGKSSADWNRSNATWVALGDDFNFKVYVGGVVTYIDGTIIGGTAWAHELRNCQIAGNALYQTISSCTVGGDQTPVTTDAAPASMPISNAQITEWETIAAAGGIISGNYTVNGTQSLGPKKIEGNLIIAGNGTLNLTGPLWVRGNITFENNSGLTVDASTGNSGAVVIADYPGNEATAGLVTLSNNMTVAGNGNAGSYPMVLSTNSSENAINMNNNSTSVILYASRGTVTVSNNGAANQISAYKLYLSNNTTVTYVNGLQSQSFSSGPGASWTFIPGTYVVSP